MVGAGAVRQPQPADVQPELPHSESSQQLSRFKLELLLLTQVETGCSSSKTSNTSACADVQQSKAEREQMASRMTSSVMVA